MQWPAFALMELRATRPPGFTPKSVGTAILAALFVGIGEETGWRGWMQPELEKRFSPLITSLIVGGNLLLCCVLRMAVNNTSRVLPYTAMFPVLLTAFLIAIVIRGRMWRRRATP